MNEFKEIIIKIHYPTSSKCFHYFPNTIIQIKDLSRRRKKKRNYHCYHPKEAIKTPIPTKSINTDQKIIFKMLKKLVTRKAKEYANEATVINNNRMATNAGSSRAHWFFVSRSKKKFSESLLFAHNFRIIQLRLLKAWIIRYLKKREIQLINNFNCEKKQKLHFRRTKTKI